MERNDPVTVARIPRKQAKRKAKKSNKKDSPPSNDKKGTNKYCSEHGWGNHDSAGCWTLHPDLKPTKFQKTGENKKKNDQKETHAMVREAMKEQLHELLTTMKNARTTKKVTFKRKRGTGKKKAASASSDTDESDHAMDHTPNPSDEEDDTVDRVKRFLEEEAEEDSS